MSAKKTRIESIIFFSKEDGAWSYMLKKSEILLNNVLNFSDLDLNSLIEFYHIKQYFDHEIFLPEWTNKQRTGYLDIAETAFRETRKRFLKLDSVSLIKVIYDLDYNNHKNFWYLFGYFETYKIIDRNNFSDSLTNFPSQIRHVLKFKQLVQFYNNEIRAFLLKYSKSAELLLSQFEEKHSGKESNYSFPKSLSDNDIHTIINSYLDAEEPNLNYVQLARNSKQLKLPPKILLKAKQTAKSLKDKHFTEENTTKFAVNGGLDMDQREPIIYDTSGTETRLMYGGAFFDTLTNDIELFSVFSNVFFYTNEQEQIDLFNKSSEVDSFERIFMRSKNEYFTGIAFSRKDMLSIIQLELFNVYLNKKGRSIEELIDGFVQHFFREKFHMDNLIFKMPDANANSSDKIRLLAPEFEYLLKQYNSFVQEGEIDHELLQIDSSPIFYGNIPSLVPKKNIISNHDSVTKIQNYFFELNGILSETENSNSPKNLFQQLMTENTIKSQLEDYKQDYVEHLVKEGLLNINNNGVIEVIDPMLVYITGILRINGSLSYWRQPLLIRSKIDLLLEEGILKSSCQLFTNEEASYINYYLNKKEFTNGHDLRNKYMHGSNNRTLEIQKNDYRYFLRVVVLMLLKLKDDIELSATLSQNIH